MNGRNINEAQCTFALLWEYIWVQDMYKGTQSKFWDDEEGRVWFLVPKIRQKISTTLSNKGFVKFFLKLGVWEPTINHVITLKDINVYQAERIQFRSAGPNTMGWIAKSWDFLDA